MPVKMIIGADVVPTSTNFQQFISGDIGALVENRILERLSACDYRIFNLEAPLVDNGHPIKKCGPSLSAPVNTVKGLKSLNPSLLTLANNHIMDYDVQGLESTITALTDNNIDYIGAGKNSSQASKPYIFTANDATIGIYACCEHEFSAADETSPGANPFNPLESLDHISSLKQQCDYVIVLFHSGKEHYRYPSPDLQKVCRKICDKGADLVVCQHSHCIGCEEKYNDSVIVYGQGNFLFDRSTSEFWQTALLLDVEFDNGVKVEYLPICKEGNGVRFANSGEAAEIMEQFNKRSEQIKERDFVVTEYAKFADSLIDNYIKALRNNGLMFRIINKLCFHRLKQNYTERNYLKMLNAFECESHRELIITSLKNNMSQFK